MGDRRFLTGCKYVRYHREPISDTTWETPTDFNLKKKIFSWCITEIPYPRDTSFARTGWPWLLTYYRLITSSLNASVNFHQTWRNPFKVFNRYWFQENKAGRVNFYYASSQSFTLLQNMIYTFTLCSYC